MSVNKQEKRIHKQEVEQICSPSEEKKESHE